MKKLVAAGVCVVVLRRADGVRDARPAARAGGRRRRGRAWCCCALRWYLVRGPGYRRRRARRQRRRGVVAPLAVSDRDADQLVGVHAGGLGPAPAPDAGPAVRAWRPVSSRPRTARRFTPPGEMLFGAELWAWVDPENVARTGGSEPGPGPGGARRNSATVGAGMTATSHCRQRRRPPTARRCSTRSSASWWESARR